MNQSPDIPLPSETVSPIQVSQLAGLTPSAALESLIQQNIDLTTRLNINLRRVADLERVAHALSGQVQNFETQKEAFREEIQVLHKRFQAQESKLLNYRLEKENAEKAYATLVIDHKSLKAKLEDERSQFESEHARWARYRHKIKNYIRPLFKSLNADSELLPEVQGELIRFKKYRSRVRKFVRPMIRNFKFQLNSYRDRCERLEVKNTELSQRIEELLNHLSTRKEQFDADQKKLVAYHEDRWSELHTKFEQTQSDLDALTARHAAVKSEKERTEDENLTLLNRAIAAERRLEEIEQRYQGDILNLQNSLANYEGMWTDVSKKLDLVTVQLEAAQRLNDSLTEDLRQERERTESLNARIQQMKIQEVALQSVRNAGPLLTPNPSIPQQIIETPVVAAATNEEENLKQEVNSKLESLFAEIQGGDMIQPSDDLSV